MKKRALSHYRFGHTFAWLKRKLSKRSKYIADVKSLYEKLGLEDKPCSLCGKNDFSLLCEGDRYGFDLNKQLCNQCGLVQTHPALSEEFHQEFYTHFYRPLYTGGVSKVNYDALIIEQEAKGVALITYLKENGFSKKQLSLLSVIEIGCSSGGIINKIKPHVHSVQGCDLDYEAINYAKESFKLNVEVATYPTNLPSSPRLFLLSHVLEHLYNPLEAFQKIHEMMEEGDYLYIAVPGLNQVAKGDYKHDLRGYFHIAHVTDFTASSLSSMAAEAGFKTINVNEVIDGLFIPTFEGKISWTRSSQDSIENIQRIEKTYKKWLFHS